MKRRGRLIGLMAGVVAWAWAGSALADPAMSFVLVHPSAIYSAIYAGGEITTDTPGVFAAFLKANPVPAGATVYFSSPGGDLGSGVLLGEAIRAARLDTEVDKVRTLLTTMAHCG